MTSLKVWSDISRTASKDAMPAFGITMSSRPSSATPASTTLRTASRSRVSALCARIRRPRASTCRTVSARSSSVAPA